MVTFQFNSWILAACVGHAGANLRSPPTGRRHLAGTTIAGYHTDSIVTDHNAIDLDQKALELLLGQGTNESFSDAKRVYQEGAHSKSVAKITLRNGLIATTSAQATVVGQANDDTEVIGRLYDTYPIGTKEIEVQYRTIDDQANYVGCQVGANPNPNTAGCFKNTGELIIDAVDYEYDYNGLEDNVNKRTLQGFSTGAQGKMGGKGYATYDKFYNYYGEYDYADQWVMAAFEEDVTVFDNGNRDFRDYDSEGREEAIKKGTAYMSVWMYVIREMEDALDDCDDSCIQCNDDSVHAWDEAVAFYTGSLEGTDGEGDGYLLYGIADYRCANFKTCGDLADKATGTSHVNIEIFHEFAIGQQHLVDGKCTEARASKERIEQMMAVPLIQGTLRYAHHNNYKTVTDRSIAKVETYAASVLPLVHACDPDAALNIYTSVNVAPQGKADFHEVKKSFEKVYGCLGIRCADVGGLLNLAGDDYDILAKPCGLSESDKNDAGLIIGLIIGGVLLISIVAILGRSSGSPGIEPKSEIELSGEEANTEDLQAHDPDRQIT